MPISKACISRAYSDEGEKRKILELLVAVKSVDLKSILNFCELFGCDEEKATFMYLEVCLLPPDDVNVSSAEQLLDTSYQVRINFSYKFHTYDLPRLVRVCFLRNLGLGLALLFLNYPLTFRGIYISFLQVSYFCHFFVSYKVS